MDEALFGKEEVNSKYIFGKEVSANRKVRLGKVLSLLKEGTLFPDFVEHGNANVIKRSLTQTFLVVFVLLYVTIQVATLKFEQAGQTPPLKHTSATDQLLFHPTLKQFDSINARLAQDRDKFPSGLVCKCHSTSVFTKNIQLPEHTYFTMQPDCAEGTMTFMTVQHFPVTYAEHIWNDEGGYNFEQRFFGYESWSSDDFISQEVFNEGTEYSAREVSIEGTCKSGQDSIEANKLAYLDQVLSSPKLLSADEVENTLSSRFKNMKASSIAAFNLMFQMDTFRHDFEGITSFWGKQLDNYLDTVTAHSTRALINTYRKMVERLLIIPLYDEPDFADMRMSELNASSRPPILEHLMLEELTDITTAPLAQVAASTMGWQNFAQRGCHNALTSSAQGGSYTFNLPMSISEQQGGADAASVSQWCKTNEKLLPLYGEPLVRQVAMFMRSVLAYQEYCTRKYFPMAPLYRERFSNSYTQFEAFDEATMREWVQTLFEDWSTGRLTLDMKGIGPQATVLFEHEGFEGAKAMCRRLPATVNHVSKCDCKIEPHCDKQSMQQFTYLFGTHRIMESEGPPPVPVSCSYYRQLELQAKMVVSAAEHGDVSLPTDSPTMAPTNAPTYDVGAPEESQPWIYKPQYDFVAPVPPTNAPTNAPTVPTNAPTNVPTDMPTNPPTAMPTMPTNHVNDTNVPTNSPTNEPTAMPTYKGPALYLTFNSSTMESHLESTRAASMLREMMKGAMVQSWDEGLQDQELLYKRYFEQCDPYDCHYDEVISAHWTVTVGLVLAFVGMTFPTVKGAGDKLVTGLFVVLGIKIENMNKIEDNLLAEFMVQIKKKEEDQEKKDREEKEKEDARKSTVIEGPKRDSMVKDPRGLRAEPAGEDDDRRFSIQVPTPRSWATSVLEGAGDAPMEGAGTGALVNHSPRMDPAVWANGILGLEEGKGGFEQGYFSEGKMEEEDPAHPMDHPIASYHDQDRLPLLLPLLPPPLPRSARSSY
jgi:hypothetical protein